MAAGFVLHTTFVLAATFLPIFYIIQQYLHVATSGKKLENNIAKLLFLFGKTEI